MKNMSGSSKRPPELGVTACQSLSHFMKFMVLESFSVQFPMVLHQKMSPKSIKINGKHLKNMKILKTMNIHEEYEVPHCFEVWGALTTTAPTVLCSEIDRVSSQINKNQ